MSKEAKRLPYFRFFSTDWRGDVPLRMCSYAARGLWIDLLTLMHESDRTGYLLIAGQKPTARQLASLLGGSEKEVVKLLAELEKAGIFSIDEDTGCIVSRRMIRDRAKEEKDRENGRGGGNPKLKAKDNPPGNPQGLTPNSNQGVNPSDKAHGRSSTSTTTSKERISPPSSSALETATPEKSARGDDDAVAIIAEFDQSRTAAFGEGQARGWPNQTDHVTAQRLVEAGATPAICRPVFDAVNAKLRAKGHKPRDMLSAMEGDVTTALAAKGRPAAKPAAAAPGGSILELPDGPYVHEVLGRVARKRTGAEALQLRTAFLADPAEGLKAIRRADRELRGEGRGSATNGNIGGEP